MDFIDNKEFSYVRLININMKKANIVTIIVDLAH